MQCKLRPTLDFFNYELYPFSLGSHQVIADDSIGKYDSLDECLQTAVVTEQKENLKWL